MNPRKPGDSGASNNMGEHGFRLIVHGVRGGNDVHNPLRRQPAKILITRPPRRIFNISLFASSFFRDVGTANV